MAELRAGEKLCKICGEIKSLDEYYKHTDTTKDRYYSTCKVCFRIKNNDNKRKYRQTEDGRAKDKAYKQSTKYKEYVKKYTSRPEVKERTKLAWDKFSNGERGKEYRKSEECRESYRKSRNTIRSSEKGILDHHLITNLRSSLVNYILSPNRTIKRKRDWEGTVGFTVKDLKEHLESNFTEEMTWDRFINGDIHIDHIIPRCNFNYFDFSSDEFKKCWSLDNLQPLWRLDNYKKGTKVQKDVITNG